MLQSPIPELILGIYSVAVIIIAVYTFGEFHLLWYLFTKNRKNRFIPERPELNEKDLPVVTVQLPMYNERYVVKALIDCCAELEYPHDRLEIQVIDDSTDETTEIARERVDYWVSKGIDFKLVHRKNREGFKAGALRDATPHAKGEFIAIFDADFRPKSDFLLKTVPYFQDDKVGIVQGRWGHINREYSVLTRAQTIFLDMFFMVEQRARSLAGFFLRFNGSGGIWRKSCIEDAGGWTSDTLSEDLDLSFRAQLKGWKVIYDQSVEAPAEVPVTMLDFKAQQYRWTKGKAQVIKKLSKEIRSSDFSLNVKAHIFFDLFNILAIPSIVVIALLSIPITFIVMQTNEYNLLLSYSSIGLINVVVVPIFMWIVVRNYNETKMKSAGEMLRKFFPFTFILLGMTFFQFFSVIDGFFSKKKIHFHRTSKYNIVNKSDSWKNKVYSPKEVPWVTFLEGILAIYFMVGLYIDIAYGLYGFLPFHIILSIGYTFVFYKSFRKA